MQIEVRCLDDKICEDCPYLKIEMKYGFKDTGDLCDIFYECGHLGMCEELRVGTPVLKRLREKRNEIIPSIRNT